MSDALKYDWKSVLAETDGHYALTDDTPEAAWWHKVMWSESLKCWQWSKARNDKRWGSFSFIKVTNASPCSWTPFPHWYGKFDTWQEAAADCELAWSKFGVVVNAVTGGRD